MKLAGVYGRLMSYRLARIERRVHARDVRFGPKVGQMGPKWHKSGSFSVLSEPKYTEICSETVLNLSHLGLI